MTMHRKAYGAETTTLAEKRQVRVICSTSEVDRAGDIVVQEGIDLAAYLTNPVVLWQHDPEQPIARCVSIGVEAGKLTALVQFPPVGISPKADEIYGLIGAEIINATSIGFMDGDAEQMKTGGIKFNTCELAEFSFVSIPANRGATVTERSATVTIDAAELAELRAKAEAPKKLADSFRTMAKALPDAAKGARSQLLKCADMAERENGAITTKELPKLTAKGLYSIGTLASVLSDLRWVQQEAEWEAEWEGDDSAVPAMLAEAMRQLGAALVAMTEEEVGELLAQLAMEEDEGEADKAAPAITVKDIVDALRGKAIPGLSLKAGRVLSAKNETDLSAARDLIDGVVQQVAGTDEGEKTIDPALYRRRAAVAALRVA